MNLESVKERLEMLAAKRKRRRGQPLEQPIVEIATALGRELALWRIDYLPEFSDLLSAYEGQRELKDSGAPLASAITALREVAENFAQQACDVEYVGSLPPISDKEVAHLLQQMHHALESILRNEDTDGLTQWQVILGAFTQLALVRQTSGLDRLRRELAAAIYRRLPPLAMVLANPVLELTTATRDQILHLHSEPVASRCSRDPKLAELLSSLLKAAGHPNEIRERLEYYRSEHSDFMKFLHALYVHGLIEYQAVDADQASLADYRLTAAGQFLATNLGKLTAPSLQDAVSPWGVAASHFE